MELILFLVFASVFAVIALLMLAARGNSATPKVLRATLAAALKMSRFSAAEEEEVDIRKRSSLSSIPWVHRLLERIDAAIALRRVLDQADMQWTPARLA